MLVLLVFSAILMAAMYGIIHDQVTYSISPEYYTKFKFPQFGMEGNISPRLGATYVGIMATWWMGIPIGLMLGFTGLIHKDNKTMFRVTIKAFLVTIMVALLTGFTGLAYGSLILARQPIENLEYWLIPDDIHDLKHFIAVGSMHNFSYAGGLIGLVLGVFFSIRQKRKNSLVTNE